jgi:subtilisin family serine protease
VKRRRFSAVVAFATGALLVVGAATGLAGSPGATDGPQATTGLDTGSAIVQLNGDPLSTYVKTKPPQGKKIDFSSSTVKSYRALLSAERNDFKQWLQDNAPNAKVTGQYDISLNAVAVQLNGTPLSTLQSAPLVQLAQYEGYYTPQAIDPDLTLINAFSAWGGAGNGANAGVKPDGSRVKVGIIDTGIDVSQPCFNDTGFPNTPKQGPPALTNNKVIVAKVFSNKAGNQGYTPAAVQAHGTHVAGTVACDYGTNLGAGHPGTSTTTYPGTGTGSISIPYGVQGVAPGAQLGNYNVFPDSVTNARSEDILNALEAAYTDGMDIVNMSLGGGPGKSPNVAWPGVQDLLSHAVNDLDQAGMISAIAAGNSGPGAQTIGSPGLAERGLTAGAVTVGQFVGVNVTVGGTDYAAAVGQFGPTSAVSGTWMSVSSNGCSALSGLSGKIALIPRGTCTFSTKIRNAQAAGAAGVVIRNNVGGPPISMAQDGTPNQPTIPGVMVANTTGALLATGHDGDPATINATLSYVQDLSTSGVLAGFSSRGPTNVDFRVKPDVTAPGVNVLSSIPGTGPESCTPTFGAPCWAFFQGTSMATPHLAGSAAVVLGQHPDWPAWAVRSAIVNTADPSVLKTSNGTCCDTDANDVGSGLENLNSAVNASLALDPVSVSFGAVPSGSGQTQSLDVTIMNLTSGALAVPAPSIAGTTGAGVSFSTSGGPFALPAGGSATVTVTMSAEKGASLGAHQATLSFGGLAHAVVFVWIKQ